MRNKIVWGDQVLDRDIDAIVNDVPFANYPFAELDALTGGIKSGEIICVCGEPASGKTSLVNQIKTHLALIGCPCLYVTYEPTRSDLTQKSLSEMSRGKLPAMGFCTHDTFPGFSEELAAVTEKYRKAAKRVAYDESRPNVIDLSVEIGQIIAETEETPVVIIDYVQLVPSINERRCPSDQTKLAEVASGLRRIANRYKCPIIIVSSITRTAYEKHTTNMSMSVLGGSSILEYTASLILALAVDGTGDTRRQNLEKSVRPVTATILKNRFGPLGSVKLDFHTQHAAFVERGKDLKWTC